MSIDPKNTRIDSNDGEAYNRPWAVIAKFDIKAGFEGEWIKLVQEVIECMKHEETFLSTSICCHPSDAGKFMLFEVWKDREEFFSTQVNRDYRHRLMERLPSLIQSPVVFDEWCEMNKI